MFEEGKLSINYTEKLLVSVGIPTYNRPDGLRRTLEYITKQTYTNLEIIISDNASVTPETKLVVNEFLTSDSRIKYFRQEENIGAFHNFKFLFDKATGDYFMWAADDDEWRPEFIESCVELFDNDTSLVCPQMELVWRLSNNKDPIKLPDLNKCISTYERISSFLKCAAPSMIYGLHKRTSLNSLVAFKSTFDFYDCALIVRILSQSNVKICDKKLYAAGIDDSEYKVKPNTTSAKSRLKYCPFILYTLESISNSDITIRQKIILICLLLQFSNNNYIYHESGYNQTPIYRKIELHLIIIFNKMLNIIHKILIPGGANVG
ncbi:MAG: hypothetical protein C0399_00795 [Syntrophus sp. (in: bacteria)]|nr:hypothetical protein [Syntrophus sp. (in: bacteria)]